MGLAVAFAFAVQHLIMTDIAEMCPLLRKNADKFPSVSVLELDWLKIDQLKEQQRLTNKLAAYPPIDYILGSLLFSIDQTQSQQNNQQALTSTTTKDRGPTPKPNKLIYFHHSNPSL